MTSRLKSYFFTGNQRCNLFSCGGYYRRQRTRANVHSRTREPLSSSAAGSGPISSSPGSNSSAENPRTGTFDAESDAKGLPLDAPVLKLRVTGLSETGNADGAGGFFDGSSKTC